MSEEPEIRVKDSRRFTTDGEAKPDAPEKNPAVAAAPEPQAEPQAAAEPESEPQSQRQNFAPPPATFELLTYSLVMQAEMSLMGQGEGEPPDLPMARHAIDMLGVLKDKTKGNLSLEENRLLENSLTELRFRYVQVQGELTRPGGGS